MEVEQRVWHSLDRLISPWGWPQLQGWRYIRQQLYFTLWMYMWRHCKQCEIEMLRFHTTVIVFEIKSISNSHKTSFNTYTAKPVCWNGWISDSYCSLKPLCSGMGEVVPARTSPTLLPPSPRTVLSLPCFKVSQCINCHDWHCKS